MVRELIEASAPAPWVIDGIRNPAEVAELRKMGRFFLIGIESGVETILARMKERGRATDTVSEAELRAGPGARMGQRRARGRAAGRADHGHGRFYDRQQRFAGRAAARAGRGTEKNWSWS